MAAEDDIVPLSAPIKTKNGDTVTSIFIAKGTVISIPIRGLNRSEEIWGADAKVFNPERWLAEDVLSKNAMQEHRHLLTFIDGPRTCLGKQFAIIEFKAALSVLIRNYKFEFESGKEDMELGKFPGLIDRPKEMSADGPYVPLRVRHV
ncbi:cytochrome P450 [Hymenopellis radicata]|nr:cytochrome P450 [Hymenopellis radicata]